MAATITTQGPCCDGYDVSLSVAGKSMTLHFPTQPSSDELTALLDQIDRDVTEAIATHKSSDQEES